MLAFWSLPPVFLLSPCLCGINELNLRDNLQVLNKVSLQEEIFFNITKDWILLPQMRKRLLSENFSDVYSDVTEPLRKNNSTAAIPCLIMKALIELFPLMKCTILREQRLSQPMQNAQWILSVKLLYWQRDYSVFYLWKKLIGCLV